MHRTRALILALAACLGLTGIAAAQGPLGPDVISTPNLTNPQRRQIEEYVARYRDDLISADPLACQQARKRLSEPLTKSAVSLAFRRAYADSVLPIVGQGARSNNEQIAANALLLAGRVATTESLGMLEQAFDDKRVPVRYAGVAGATLVFAQINDNAPAIPQGDVTGLVTRLAGLIRQEPNPLVLDAAVRSLVAAGNQTRFSGVQSAALTQLGAALAERIRTIRQAPDPQTLESLLRASDTMRAVLIKDIANTQSDVATQAALFSGHVLAFIAERLSAGDFRVGEGGADPADETERARSAAIQLLDLSETTIKLVNDDYKGGQPLTPWDLAAALEAGDANRVTETIDQQITGPRGVLVRPPFGFPANTFDR